MTPAYAAPECLRRAVSAHSDQYSLAVSYCQLRGGRLPFIGDQAQVVTGHLLDPPDLTMLPQAERPAVARALAKRPEDRWPACRAFAQAVAEGRLDAAVAPGKEFINALGMRLVRIRPGTFTMGSPQREKRRNSDEGPQHEVTITRPFYLGVYPVTQAEYERVMGKNPSWFSERGGGKDKVGGRDTGRFPAEMVSWEQAKAFCEELTRRDEKKPAGWGYELPTEAEWEYACRAGTTTACSFGDDPEDLGEYAWYRSNSGGGSHEVGTRKPNPWGLYDMHGNVWEWCADGKRRYERGPVQDPQGPGGGESRVLRGGPWHYHSRYCRSAHRYFDVPDARDGVNGFRVVLRPPAGTP
jgi:formylglycine-generating enzyme required for sulfatase activity